MGYRDGENFDASVRVPVHQISMLRGDEVSEIAGQRNWGDERYGGKARRAWRLSPLSTFNGREDSVARE